jgi:hypothetical protein
VQTLSTVGSAATLPARAIPDSRSHATNPPTSSSRTRDHTSPRWPRKSNQSRRSVRVRLDRVRRSLNRVQMRQERLDRLHHRRIPIDQRPRLREWTDLASAPHRYFTGSPWVLDRDVSVSIDGTQDPDGRVTRFILVAEGKYERLTELTSITARELGRALIAAADEVDRWAESAEGNQTREVTI